ncbi:hypothetical protein [Streptomyces fragilis]|uniref:Uncharacterized protein n=1 Tax=Streptomyces fragilis TaxID=67301 RepID=A0ABV2YK92_9ACTN|nr:hypothetical protein [Streptomyces fragilis]
MADACQSILISPSGYAHHPGCHHIAPEYLDNPEWARLALHGVSFPPVDEDRPLTVQIGDRTWTAKRRCPDC